jgi:biotin operon repressor
MSPLPGDSGSPIYSIAVPTHLLADREVSATAKLLYGVIDSFQKKSGVCFASNERLAEELGGCTARTVSKCVSELRAGGYIVIDEEKGRKIYLSTSVTDGQGGRSFLPPPTNISSRGVEENFQGGRKNFPPSNTVSDNIPPLSPPAGGNPPKSPKKGRDYKAQAAILPERFEGFWTFYRSHMPDGSNAGNRQRAIRAWDKLAPNSDLATAMAKSLAKQVKSKNWLSGVGVPHASTWLNNHGWEDDWGPAPGDSLIQHDVQRSEEAAEWVT